MPTRRSPHLVGPLSPILHLACFTARKDSPKWRNTLKWPNKSACKDSQFFARSAVGPLRSSSPPNRAGHARHACFEIEAAPARQHQVDKSVNAWLTVILTLTKGQSHVRG